MGKAAFSEFVSFMHLGCSGFCALELKEYTTASQAFTRVVQLDPEVWMQSFAVVFSLCFLRAVWRGVEQPCGFAFAPQAEVRGLPV